MLLVASSVLLLCVPVAIVLTFLLLPLWSWVEATFAVESVGHSGPADWCFFAVYGLLALCLLLLWFWRRRRSSILAAAQSGSGFEA
jgi:MYXO-CTERM domain-containing protein